MFTFSSVIVAIHTSSFNKCNLDGFANTKRVRLLLCPARVHFVKPNGQFMAMVMVMIGIFEYPYSFFFVIRNFFNFSSFFAFINYSYFLKSIPSSFFFPAGLVRQTRRQRLQRRRAHSRWQKRIVVKPPQRTQVPQWSHHRCAVFPKISQTRWRRHHRYRLHCHEQSALRALILQLQGLCIRLCVWIMLSVCFILAVCMMLH